MMKIGILAVTVALMSALGTPSLATEETFDPLIAQNTRGPQSSVKLLYQIAQGYPNVAILLEPQMPVRDISRHPGPPLKLSQFLIKNGFAFTSGSLNGRSTYIITGFTDEKPCSFESGHRVEVCRTPSVLSRSRHMGFSADSGFHAEIERMVNEKVAMTLRALLIRGNDLKYTESFLSPKTTHDTLHVGERDVVLVLTIATDVGRNAIVKGEAGDYAFQLSDSLLGTEYLRR